jgi:hypothetical protein
MNKMTRKEFVDAVMAMMTEGMHDSDAILLIVVTWVARVYDCYNPTATLEELQTMYDQDYEGPLRDKYRALSTLLAEFWQMPDY